MLQRVIKGSLKIVKPCAEQGLWKFEKRCCHKFFDGWSIKTATHQFKVIKAHYYDSFFTEKFSCRIKILGNSSVSALLRKLSCVLFSTSSIYTASGVIHSSTGFVFSNSVNSSLKSSAVDRITIFFHWVLLHLVAELLSLFAFSNRSSSLLSIQNFVRLLRLV